jgi:2,4-dienoyl-CoA reductase-like NADH-dependent reductase (Old Yellow Enzyme family)
MIITEGTYTDELLSKTNHNQPGIANVEQMKAWKHVVTAVHRHNALIISQLMHGGALSEVNEEMIAPSAVQPTGLRSTDISVPPSPFPMPRAMRFEVLTAWSCTQPMATCSTSSLRRIPISAPTNMAAMSGTG